MITLAADFGGRRIKLGVVQNGAVRAHGAILAEADQSLAARLERVAEELRRLCGPGVALRDCAGVAFAYPSVIDTARGRILDHFGKFGDAARIDLRGWARQELGLPLAIDNDARMALIGEWRYGAGRGCDNLAILTLGTGLGTSAILEGRVLRGAHGQAGILGGHFTVRYGGRPCVCGNLGCAEAEASTWILPELARVQPGFPGSRLAQEEVLDYAAVFRLAAAGDACALALRDQTLQVWSAAVVNLVHAYDPEKVILAGGIMGSAAQIVPVLQGWVRRHAHTSWGEVEVVPSQLGDRAALLAGEWLLGQHLEPATRENA